MLSFQKNFNLFRYDFTGTLIVVPDVGVLAAIGSQVERGYKNKPGEVGEGVRGLKALGVRELNYKIAFLACSVTATSLRVNRLII